MAEFSTEAIAAAVTSFAAAVLLAGDYSPEEAAQWLEQQAEKVRRSSEAADCADANGDMPEIITPLSMAKDGGNA